MKYKIAGEEERTLAFGVYKAYSGDIVLYAKDSQSESKGSTILLSIDASTGHIQLHSEVDLPGLDTDKRGALIVNK